MQIKKGEQHQLTISGMSFGGRGIGRLDGLAVFVERTAPLDVALVRITKRKKNHAEAVLLELIEHSPFRLTPPCIYSNYCGGCKWQFIDYGRQLIYKQQQIIDSLLRIGGLDGVPVHSIIPSPKIFGYRNKMEFSCSDRRWLFPEEMQQPSIDRQFALGLHIPQTFDKIIDIEKCLLQHDLGNAILNDVRTLMKSSGAPPYGLKTHSGFWRFLMLRHSEAYDQWMVNIVTAADDSRVVQPLADILRSKYPRIVSVINNITSRKAGIALGEKERCLSGNPKIRDRVGPFEFDISANSFFQVNTQSARSIFETAKDYAALTGTESVLDLYSGTGTVAVYFSEAAKSVVGIEISESAVADAMENSLLNHIKNSRFILGDVLNLKTHIDFPPDVIIIDPPRVGMHPKVVKQILEMAPSRMVYISCNPATLARDLGLMKEKYDVLEIQPVDMFPHTAHIESVVKLKRK
ncbi:MAG: 23S rRNA (uracil-5-)-methyltransferase RumA [Deltaproteobacteria bacterium RBG_13_49_15]|nr:MAG: 23S rRNA (uracil-5-)-methyltransferase RumA [Deltaproteobacteria bacterium RBG_13_49_15]